MRRSSSRKTTIFPGVILTLDVAEQVGADEGEEQHGDGQGAVGQHLPHLGVQERTERERERRV